MLLLMTSAFVDKRQEAVLGEKAPALVINSCDGEMSLESLEGNWVILSFWSAADAQSRMMQNDVAAYARGISDPGKAHNLEIVSVNFDRSENLMKEIVRLDNLDETRNSHRRCRRGICPPSGLSNERRSANFCNQSKRGTGSSRPDDF